MSVALLRGVAASARRGRQPTALLAAAATRNPRVTRAGATVLALLLLGAGVQPLLSAIGPREGPGADGFEQTATRAERADPALVLRLERELASLDTRPYAAARPVPRPIPTSTVIGATRAGDEAAPPERVLPLGRFSP